MTTPKTPAKKAAPRKRATRPKSIAVQTTKMMPLADLQMYHKNPRVGNVDAIAESLRESGQYRAIVVNVGSKTGRKNEILGGNHTYLGMKRNGEKEMLVSFVDVDEQQAKKIVLADNKTADLGEYDEKIIAELFESLDTVSGTGYSTEEVEDLLTKAQEDLDNFDEGDNNVDVDGLLSGIKSDDEEPRSSREQYMEERDEATSENASERSTRIPIEVNEEDDAELEKDAPIDKMAELQVVLELKEDNVWKDPNNFYGIPRIPEASILEEFPKDIVTWIGHEFTEDKKGRHFLYNYSLGGTKGLDFSRTLLAFNTYDAKFASWWETPAYNLSRMMVKGLSMAVVPDFSYYYSEARIHHLWGVYRANWLGRFFAEAGLKVVPRVQWDFRDPQYMETAIQGVPLNTPTLECSIQNVNEDEDRTKAAKQLRAILEHIKPEHFMFYGGNPAVRMFKECGWKGDATHVLSYSNARREAGAFDKKEGAKGLTTKQKNEIREKYGAGPKKPKERDKGVSEDDDEGYDDE